MKGSKALGKSILVVALSLVLIFSAVLPIAVMGSENNGGGSKGTPLGSYRYYSVKSGETLASIAEKNGVTVSDIMTFNNLKDGDNIYRGQILKIPSTTANSSSNSIVSSKISIKSKEANVTDVLSAIAYNAGYTVIFKGVGDQKIDLDLTNVSPLKAIDFITRMVGLSFIKDGNTILVATAGELNSTFPDAKALTKLSFKYITYEELMTQANALGLSDVQVVSKLSTKRDVWVSTFPKQMAKLQELINILDVKDNISVGSSSIASAFTPIELKYISASELSSLLDSLGLHKGITMGCRPMTLFVYVSGTALADILTIKKVVDVPASASAKPDDQTSKPSEPSTETPGGTVPPVTEKPNEPGTSLPTTPENPNSNEPIVFEKYDLVNISRSDAEALIAQYAKGVTTYGHERMTKSLWLFGTQEQITNAKAVISQIDANVASASSTVHTYTAQNCSVDELMARFEKVSHTEVQVHTYDHSAISNSLIVICDDITWNSEIHDLLVTLDTVDTGEAMWLPLESSTKETAGDIEPALNARFNAMASLYPNIFGGVEHKVVIITDGGSSKGVMYVKTTSDKAKRMQEIMGAFDNT